MLPVSINTVSGMVLHLSIQVYLKERQFLDSNAAVRILPEVPDVPG